MWCNPVSGLAPACRAEKTKSSRPTAVAEKEKAKTKTKAKANAKAKTKAKAKAKAKSEARANTSESHFRKVCLCSFDRSGGTTSSAVAVQTQWPVVAAG